MPCFASSGMSSQIWKSPVVEIGLNSPAVGAPGFMSHISIDGGPPPSHNMIADLWFLLSD